MEGWRIGRLGGTSADAIRKATRDGAPAIDLIDEDLLIDKLKELESGVKTETIQVEQVTVEREWFLGI
jgi:restriction system protein